MEGLLNSVIKKDDVEQIAQARMDICNECPHIDRQGDKCFVPGTQPCCSKCGCKLAWKTRSLSSSCGDEENPRWNAIVSEQEEAEIFNKLNIKNE
jgi:hypothetical protein